MTEREGGGAAALLSGGCRAESRHAERGGGATVLVRWLLRGPHAEGRPAEGPADVLRTACSVLELRGMLATMQLAAPALAMHGGVHFILRGVV